MTVAKHTSSKPLESGEIEHYIKETLATCDLDGKRVLCIVPDSTRSMPMAATFRALVEGVKTSGGHPDFLLALGTHPPMSDEAINQHFGITSDERSKVYGDVGIFNHEWQNPDALANLGTIDEEIVEEISGGLMRESVGVTVNRRIFDYDLLFIAGPVFPHEVAGFSGGNKYFFPGIAGAEILNLFHWLGALISNPVINGTKNTPVRQVIDRSAALIPIPKRAFCFHVREKECQGVYFGTPEEAWSAAADAASETHIIYKDKPYESVLALCPDMYDEIWVAGKCMYKLEPIVADGGELIIYGPHIKRISVTHGRLIKKIGYHTRDYFLARMDEFRDIPGGILAHSTHVRGIGTYEDGVEKPRVQVTLATGIPKDECEAINLGYRDPSTIDPEGWRGKEDEGRLLVPNAGEILYKLRHGNPQPKTPGVAIS